jgi:hypothetical protein
MDKGARNKLAEIKKSAIFHIALRNPKFTKDFHS